MEQITIDEILKLTEPAPADPKEWRPIRSGARIGLTSYLPLFIITALNGVFAMGSHLIGIFRKR